MIYNLIFDPKAEIQLRKFDGHVRERILSALDRIKTRPFSYDLKKLQGTKYYRLRVGEYRIIIDVQQDKLIIVVIEIGHRKNIYD
ncbi:MAG: type II toxin-antitoxin system RelE/ParE family toxin [Microgenomates group bacterium]